MAAAAIIIVFLVIGAGVFFVAYSGGPGRAREAYLTGGRGFFRIALPLIYLGIGIAVPAIVIANGDQGQGGVGRLATSNLNEEQKRGKELFLQACSTCHSLAAVNARGVTGPNLDEIGEVTKQRIVSAIRVGGTGQNRMPAGLFQGENAEAVAAYVAAVAGRETR